MSRDRIVTIEPQVRIMRAGELALLDRNEKPCEDPRRERRLASGGDEDTDR